MDRCPLQVGTSLLVLIVLSAATTNARAEEFPITVYAAEHGVMVRGGAGDAYYATQELQRGQELTAYRLEQGEWYAVRPPEGSYSLVSANAIADQGDGYGEVVRNGAASRIGSSLNDLQDTVHVRLEQGERVRILGSQTKSGVKWLRIQPPHGEFRWVRKADVVTSPPEPAPYGDAENPISSPAVLPLAHNGGERYTAPPLAGETTPGWEIRQEAPQPLPTKDTTTDGTTPQPLAGIGQTATSPLTDSVETNLSDPFARQIFMLEMELGRMVAEAPLLWNLSTLEQDASRLMASARSESEREAVRQFAGRLERFASIRKRYEMLPPIDALLAARASNTSLPTSSLPNTVAQSVTEAANPKGDDSRFDAMGVLRPVASTRADAPKFALVNDTGQIVTFVTPAPDVNLQPYVGRRVGVSGTRGFMAEFNHRHVTAGRVMPVGDRLVR